ncbi:MAG: LapA family protein [FCB group bacterium]|nr:LapA family protein [FCB group bacterium]
MKLIKIFTVLAVFILLLVFFLKNNQMVAVDLIFRKYDQLSVSFIMLGALTLGVLIGYGVAIVSIWSLRAENRAMRKKIKELTDELNDLRNVTIADDLGNSDSNE